MIARFSAALALGACLYASRAQAHRLDEYLEQTLIEIAPGRLALHVDLTPGVSVAARVLPTLDTDHDGIVTPAEGAAYTDQVRHDLSLRLNGEELPLRVTDLSYPTVDDIRSGLGTIALTFEARTPAPGVPTGTLRFANRHDPADGVYLVNCLLPNGRDVRVVSQTRSPNQATYEAELAVGEEMNRRGVWTGAAIGALTLAGAVFVWRTLRKRDSSRAAVV